MAAYKQKLSLDQVKALTNSIHTKQSTRAEVCRAQAILLLNDGTDTAKIEALTSYRRRQVFRLRRRYRTLGIEAIADQRLGQPKTLLTKQQLQEVATTLHRRLPSDFGYESSFWTTSILGDFIQRQYKVQYRSKTSYYLIFKRAKFTFHKPGRVYERHSDAEVEQWHQDHDAQIVAALEDPETVVLTEDEMILSTQTTFQKIWLPQGEYPKVAISNTKKNRSVYGFLNLKTGQEHAYKTEQQTMFITVAILKQIRQRYPKQKLFLIWDGAGWHRGSAVQRYIAADGQIETLYFPRYAPEVNPQEHVWKAGRDHCTHNAFIANIDTATDDFITYLNGQKFGYALLGFSAIS
jgi:transposase